MIAHVKSSFFWIWRHAQQQTRSIFLSIIQTVRTPFRQARSSDKISNASQDIKTLLSRLLDNGVRSSGGSYRCPFHQQNRRQTTNNGPLGALLRPRSTTGMSLRFTSVSQASSVREFLTSLMNRGAMSSFETRESVSCLVELPCDYWSDWRSRASTSEAKNRQRWAGRTLGKALRRMSEWGNV